MVACALQLSDALAAFPQPLAEEVAAFNPYMQRIFDVLQQSQGEDGRIALHEPAMAYGLTDFDATRDRAATERGIVIPGLNEKGLNAVSVSRHDFVGNKPISQA